MAIGEIQNNQDTQQVEDLNEKIGTLDNSVLNTPAKEPKDLNKLIPADKVVETYFQLNQPSTQQPDSEVVLDVGGKKEQIKSSELTPNKSLQAMLGMDVEEAEFSSGAFFLVVAIIVVTLGTIALSLKRADYIAKIEKELDEIKKGKITNLH